MKPTGIVAIIVGVLALIAAVVIPTMVAANVALDTVYATNTTTTGQATGKILNEAKFRSTPTDPYEQVNLISTRVTTANTTAQAQPDAQAAGAAVFDTTNTLVRADNQAAVLQSSATYAFVPSTSALVNCCGANVDGDTAIDFRGVMPLKFPFDTPQADLEVFDQALLAPVPTKFVGVKDIDGLQVYEFNQTVATAQVPGGAFLTLPSNQAKPLLALIAPQLAEQVAALPDGQDVALYQFYGANNTYLVEPTTGQIVDATITSTSTLRLAGGSTDVLTVAELTATGTNVPATVASIKSTLSSLNTYGVVLPIILGIVGVVLVVAGIVLLVLISRRNKAAALTATSAANDDDSSGDGEADTDSPVDLDKAPAAGVDAASATSADGPGEAGSGDSSKSTS